ncbi:glucose-6-phosphate isomerase family protein [Rhizobium tubonense]|uniref:glucose-6-phosphate isomerase family protein n=1 Tax=Rhizobium tubonense TaxID=484088 RepID=UPI0023BA0066|nr:glucose-6-phosphate isomerase family protein [Rhizobium tubonense]
MRPGTCASTPPDWAHRSVNTGPEKLIFVWVGNTPSGQDYGEILSKGMRKRVIEAGGVAKVVPNPDYPA